MEVRPWVAASGALALHALAIAGIVAIAVPKVVTELVRPVEVVLIPPPPPEPPKVEIARPPPPAPEPPRPEPPVPARAEPPPPKPAAPPPKPKPPRRVEAAKPRPAPRPQPVAPPKPPAPETAPSEPVVATAPSEPVVAAAPVAQERPAAITAAPAPEGAPVAPSVSAGVPSAPPAPVRTAPRLDASWAGNAPPSYPPMARRLGEEGEVRLDVHVGANGRVLEVRLKRSSGSQLLDETAIETVKKWRFTPATVDGKPVAEWYYDWKWVFKLES